MRHPDWVARLAALLREAETRAFDARHWNCALFALAALVVLGFALAPIMAATGLWAHTSAEEHRAQAREIERLLAEKD